MDLEGFDQPRLAPPGAPPLLLKRASLWLSLGDTGQLTASSSAPVHSAPKSAGPIRVIVSNMLAKSDEAFGQASALLAQLNWTNRFFGSFSSAKYCNASPPFAFGQAGYSASQAMVR